MTRPRHLSLLLIALSIFVYMHAEVHGGPLSLSFARSFRSGREIRTPFKSSGIMVARGFGKRNAMPVIEDASGASTVTSGDKFTTSALISGNNALANGYGDTNDNDRLSIDWLTTVMAANPKLARFILHHFLDLNGDGKISSKEFAAPTPMENIEYF